MVEVDSLSFIIPCMFVVRFLSFSLENWGQHAPVASCCVFPNHPRGAVFSFGAMGVAEDGKPLSKGESRKLRPNQAITGIPGVLQKS